MQNPLLRCRSIGQSAVGAAMLTLLMCGAAQAQVSITYPGNGSFGENVLFTNNPPDGFHVVGVLNSGNNNTFNVNFDSFDDVLHGNGGQARLEPVNGRLHDVCVSLDTGFGFEEYIFNAFRDGLKGSVPMMVFGSFDAAGGGSPGGFFENFNINNGSNFFDVKADPGFLLTMVCFSTPNEPDTDGTEFGLIDLRQNRITGPQPIGVVPEGNSLAMLGLGGMPMLGLILRRRRSV